MVFYIFIIRYHDSMYESIPICKNILVSENRYNCNDLVPKQKKLTFTVVS